MSRLDRRKERIKSEISMTRVLADFGYYVHAGASQEQQFSCDLHGDGSDSSPSARVYPHSESWHCFGCGQSRDAIQTVREKQGLGFVDAIAWLEKRYNLPTLPWTDEDEAAKQARRPVADQLEVDTSRTYEQEEKRLEALLMGITEDRDLPMDIILGLWEGFDKVRWMVSEKGPWSEGKGKAVLGALRERAFERLREHR